MSIPPSRDADAQALLDSLQRLAPAMAWVDTEGTVRWCTAAFDGLFASASAVGTTLHTLLGSPAAAVLAGLPLEIVSPAGQPWRLQARAQDGQLLVSAVPLQEVHTLRERLDLVQEFTQTGVFERDPKTMLGHWDRRMFEIWGLPPDPEGRAPDYARTAMRMFVDDIKPGAYTASMLQPGPHQQRVRILRTDGQVRHLDTRWKVLFDAEHKPHRVLGINTDDTEVFELGQHAARLSTELDVALTVGRIGLWRVDIAAGRVLPDERGSEIIGVPYSTEGVTLEEARARIHPDDVALAELSAQKTLRTGEPTDMQLRYPAPGGGWRHVMLRRALQRGPDGRPIGFIGVLMDVTERVEEMQRSQEYARRLESAAEAARVGLWSTQLNSPVPSWNRLMFELFGLDPAQGALTLPEWLERCVHEGDRAGVHDSIMRWWERGEGDHEIEFRTRRHCDGALRWLVMRGHIDRVGPERRRRAEGVAIDITEQQDVLRQLRETVERMSLTTRALGLGTWTAGPGLHQVRWDEQMFRLRGVESPARRITQDEIPIYLHPDDRQPVIDAQTAHVNEGAPWRNAFRVLWPDGQVRWLTSHSVPIYDRQGRLEGRIGVNWDSTDAHLAAQALREREVAVAESQAKSQAMSRISHELRTPLNAMLGFTQLLRGAQADSDPERRARWLAHAEDAGRHLLALIDDVLELSQAQVGELKLACEPVNAAAVVEAAISLVAGQARRREVVVQRGAMPGRVLADAVRLRQVVINLLSNAIKYNRPGGEVRVWSDLHDDRVALHVVDNGLGIAPDRLRDAFEPFNRLGAESSGVEGSGIGLAIVKVLVEMMGGEVQASSQLGQGSHFTVMLPAAPADAETPAAAPPAEPVQPAAPSSAHVLYIEDNPVNALLVREMLAHRPALTLDIAEDGGSGVQRALAQQPQLILVDMLLPDMDGLAVLRALRADARTAAIPCVALSANATASDVAAARAAGFVDYWTKPIDLRRFLEGIDERLSTRA